MKTVDKTKKQNNLFFGALAPGDAFRTNYEIPFQNFWGDSSDYFFVKVGSPFNLNVDEDTQGLAVCLETDQIIRFPLDVPVEPYEVLEVNIKKLE